MASAFAIATLVLTAVIFAAMSFWFWKWLWRWTQRTFPDTSVFIGELQLPGYNWCGPGTHVEERKKGNTKPVNELDKACMDHDNVYANPNTTADQVRKADETLRDAARTARLQTADEEIDARIVAEGMELKMGLENARLLPRGSFSRGSRSSPKK